MAATEKGVWGLQDVRDKILASEWDYTGAIQLWVQGNNGSGKLGLNNATPYSSPKQLPGTTWGMGAQAVNSTLNIKSDGTLWAWGYNAVGQLAQNNLTSYSSPRQIPGTTWKTVDASANHIIATKTDGTLWTWGEGGGRLGLNYGWSPSQIGKSSPTQVGTDTNWAIAIASGVGQSYGVKTDGTLWGWGDNTYGELGINNRTNYSSPMQVGTDTNWSTSMHNYSPSINGYYTLGAVKTDNTLWIWGNNEQGMLGLNDQADRSSPTQIGGSNWKSVGSSSYASAGLKTDGTLWSWGRNQYGNLGQGTSGTPTRKSSPTQIGTDTDWVLLANAAFNCQGAVKSNGEFWGWGANEDGVLGNENSSQQDSPIKIPGTYSKTLRPRIQNVGQLYREL